MNYILDQIGILGNIIKHIFFEYFAAEQLILNIDYF